MVRRSGASGSESRRGPNGEGPSPAAPLADVLGGIRRGVVTLVSRESRDGPAEGRRTEEQKEKDEAAAGTGGGEDKGRQAEASGERMEVVAAGAEGQEEERGEQAVANRRADPFNLAESDRLDGFAS